jgi:type IX secretion system PorP/SprF family membrane protein
MNIALKTKLLLLFPAFVLVLGLAPLRSQDIHFSQYYNSPLTLSPALTGIAKGDVRVSGLYRSQWNAANAPYKTFLVAAEKKFYNINHDGWWFSGGLNLYQDNAGDGNLSTSSLALTGSYTRLLDRNNFLSLGLSAGLAGRAFDIGDLTFDDMWNGDIFDPNRPVNEDFSDRNILYPDFGVGLNYRMQVPRKRTKVDIGAGIFHLNQPNQSFLPNDPSQLSNRFSLYLIPVVQVTATGDVVGALNVQAQGDYFEALGNVAYRHYLITQRSKEVAVQFGVGYRFNEIGDALTPAAELHYRDWVVGLSWDMNISEFKEATNRNGGPEIAVRYIIHKVYPLKAFKACPLI